MKISQKFLLLKFTNEDFMKIRDPRWMLVLPPAGRARSIGMTITSAFQQELGNNGFVFDTLDVFQRVWSCLKEDEEAAALEWMNQQWVVRALEWNITHLLMLSLAPIPRHYVELLRQQGVRSIHWLYEDHRIADYWNEVLPAYDMICSTQIGVVQQECEDHGVAFRYLPLGCREQKISPFLPWDARAWDAVFVGQATEYRVKALERLVAGGLKLAIYGEGWDEQDSFLQSSVVTLNEDETPLDLFRKARLGLHLSRNGDNAGSLYRGLNQSFWDSLNYGVFPVIERMVVNPLSLDGMCYAEFGDITELLAICMTLRFQGVAAQDLSSNQTLVQKRHSFNHRIRSILEWIEDLDG